MGINLRYWHSNCGLGNPGFEGEFCWPPEALTIVKRVIFSPER
jgi:hypothetical protein